MTNKEFFDHRLHYSVYELKEGTKASYYRKDGLGDDSTLPERLSIRHRRNESLKGQFEWSADVEGRLDGCFKKGETSLYKLSRPYKVHTTIYKASNYPTFIGYGTIGISGMNEKGRMPDTRDLVILYSRSHERGRIEIFRFIGCAFPEYIKPAFDYVFSRIKESY